MKAPIVNGDSRSGARRRDSGVKQPGATGVCGQSGRAKSYEERSGDEEKMGLTYANRTVDQY